MNSIRVIQIKYSLTVELSWRKPKGDSGKKTAKKIATICDNRHDTLIICGILRQFATCHDNFRLFVPLTWNVIKRHKLSSQAVIRCHKTSCDNLRQFMTIFCHPLFAVPFWISLIEGQPCEPNLRIENVAICDLVRKVQMGALKWGLKATPCNLCTIVCNCALSWPFVKGIFVAKWRQF